MILWKLIILKILFTTIINFYFISKVFIFIMTVPLKHRSPNYQTESKTMYCCLLQTYNIVFIYYTIVRQQNITSRTLKMRLK